MFRFYSITCVSYTISWNNFKYKLSSNNFKFFFTQVTNTVLLHLTAGRQALWTPFQVQNWILAIINFDHVGHINVILPRLQVLLCLATILLLTCSHFHLQWPFLTSWMASLVEMRPGCNIINQVDFERLFLKFNLSLFHDLRLYSMSH